jgi:multiple sugar transport system permease protein
LPWISPVVFFAIVYASIGALQVYESIVILTQGGPGDATRSMSIHIVEEALVRQFMRSQPKALEEAALMDGAGYLKIFYRISLPQSRPALSALGIITFTQTWNYYFQARVLLEPQPAMTLPIAMDLLRGYLSSGNLSVVMAAMSMAVLPVILIFLLAQKLVIEGVTMSGIKN